MSIERHFLMITSRFSPNRANSDTSIQTTLPSSHSTKILGGDTANHNLPSVCLSLSQGSTHRKQFRNALENGSRRPVKRDLEEPLPPLSLGECWWANGLAFSHCFPQRSPGSSMLWTRAGAGWEVWGSFRDGLRTLSPLCGRLHRGPSLGSWAMYVSKR